MKYVDEYRDKELVGKLAKQLHRLLDRPMRIMEVCGTHTMSIFSHGLRTLFPNNLELISGPGCPVCVTPINHINDYLTIAGMEGVSTAVFGDLIRVPGTDDSLAGLSAKGAEVKVVYSPADALRLARQYPSRQWLFPSVGFETTAPSTAAVLLEADRLGVDNFTVYPANKIIPPALDVLFADDTVQLDGLLCPGHVSAIIGLTPYHYLAEKHRVACVVAGFEPTDIFQALIDLAGMIREQKTGVHNCYPRVVSEAGNPKALELISRVFHPVDSRWRGLGMIPQSGLMLKDEFSRFNALHRFPFTPNNHPDPSGCRCGEILKGTIQPAECPMYRSRCTPSHPVGPCMVSSEGTCAAHYRYGFMESENG